MLTLLTPIVLQIIIPLSFLVWQWQRRPKSWLEWGLGTILIASYLLSIVLADLWLLIPWYVGYLYLILFLAISIKSFFKLKTLKRWVSNGWLVWVRTAIYVSLIALFAHIMLSAASAYSLPDVKPVALSLPLKNGTYYIANGGNNTLLNAHLEALNNDKYRQYRGNSYAVDIIKLNRFGFRASKLIPKQLADYEIFGELVYAPCAGTVKATENSLPDLVPPQRDRQHLAGNHIILTCKDADILLAHFQQGSVVVKPGDNVAEQQLLGKVGNTGKTDEPHLHIHAQLLKAKSGFYDTDPLPMLLDGQYLVRNQRVTR